MINHRCLDIHRYLDLIGLSGYPDRLYHLFHNIFPCGLARWRFLHNIHHNIHWSVCYIDIYFRYLAVWDKEKTKSEDEIAKEFHDFKNWFDDKSNK